MNKNQKLSPEEAVNQAPRLKSGKWSKATQARLLKLVEEARLENAASSLFETGWERQEELLDESDLLERLDNRVRLNPAVPAAGYDENLALGPIGD